MWATVMKRFVKVVQNFNQMSIKVVYPKSSARPDAQRAFNDEAREQLRAIVRQSPRTFGCERSVWSLHLLAEVSYHGLVHPDTMGETLNQFGIKWKKAKWHIHSPDEQDESWFQRFVQPHADGRSAPDLPLKLTQQPFKR